MPLKLDIKSVFTQRSDRVKGVDIHPTEPWILACLYNGHVYIWNYVEGSLVKSFEITDLPVRTAKFVPRKQWVVCGADDMHVRVYNYNTMDKVKQFEAHTDYIRHVAVHPTLPYLLTCSDDMLIKLWDWEKGWACTQVFEGHSHYVMHIVFNPKDPNTFASASLDRTVKVWSIGSHVPNYTLEGHEKGVNCVDYYAGGDRPYLASGADDRLVKVWDYQTKACLQTLDGHSHNVTSVAFHPELPLLLTGGEDGAVKAWHSTTFRLENTLNYNMERVWSIACARGSSAVVIGYDEGAVMVRLGRDEPVASMDVGGKIVWARHNEVQTANVRGLSGEASEPIVDGERLALAVKDLGSSEQYPQYLKHSPNGRFVAVCGDGEYVIYTALAWRNKAFGAALDFAWGEDSNTYAVRESANQAKVFRNFKEALTIRLGYAAEGGLRGGSALAALARDAVVFYDWGTGSVIRRIEAEVRDVCWSDDGSSVALVGPTGVHVLAFDRAAVEEAFANGSADPEDGIEDAFDLQFELGEAPTSCFWVGDCFVYSSPSLRICYAIGGETTVLAHADRPLHLLGYLAATSRIYALDRTGAVVSYSLLLPIIEFKTRVLRGDVDSAVEDLLEIAGDEPAIAAEQGALAKFLESQGHLEAASQLATDPTHKFELALSLGRLAEAADLAAAQDSALTWRALGEAALEQGALTVAQRALGSAKDRSGELLLAAAARNSDALAALAKDASSEGARNVAFAALWLLGDVDACLDLLLDAGRLPEAALLTRTYRPSKAGAIVRQWRADLAKTNAKAAEALADPDEYPNLFPGLEDALQRERELFTRAEQGAVAVPAPESPVGPPLQDEPEEEERDMSGGIIDGNDDAFVAPLDAVVHTEVPFAKQQDDDEEDDVFDDATPEPLPPPTATTAAFVSEPLVAPAPPSPPPPTAVPSPVAPVEASHPPPAVTTSVPVPAPAVDDLAEAFGALTADEEALLAEEGDDLDLGDVDDEDDWGLDEDEEDNAKRD